MGPGEQILFTALAVLLLALLVSVIVRSFQNPIENVADELHSPLPFAEVDRRVAKVLDTTTRTGLRMVLPGTYTLSYRHTPGIAIVLGIMTFPIGLLMMFIMRRDLQLTISITSDGTGSLIRVVGRTHRKLAVTVGEAVSRNLDRAVAARR
jgi:hypothetical protein